MAMTNHIIDGMKAMLRDGIIHTDMSFNEVLQNTDEPDIHEFDDLGEMLQYWDAARVEFRRELMPLKGNSHTRSLTKS